MDEQQETYEEEVDGGVMRVPATRWKNTSAQAVTMELFIDSARANPRWKMSMPADAKTNPASLPAKWLRVVIRPGEETLVPSYLDQGVQTLRCEHPACRQWPLGDSLHGLCADPTHEKVIVGGLGPGLTRVSPRIAPTTPQLSRELEPALPSVAPTTIDDRLMLRARRGVQ